MARAARLVHEAIGDASPDIFAAYRLLLGLGSHDLSAMRELIGVPERVISASHWNGGRFMTATFGYDGFNATFEMGVDLQRRFDAHLEVFGEVTQIRVQYDTPYIRHLPTTLIISETVDEAFNERVIRPTFKDPYTHDLEYSHDVGCGVAPTGRPPEASVGDRRGVREVGEALRLVGSGPLPISILT